MIRRGKPHAVVLLHFNMNQTPAVLIQMETEHLVGGM